jgi:outer membrane protein assembly factor BamB
MNFASRVLTWRRSRSRLAAVLAVGAVVSVFAAVPAWTASAAGNPASTTGSSAPPPLTVLTPGPHNGDDDIFLAPVNITSTSSSPQGPEIVTTTGKVVWFHPLPTGAFATDFRTQTYQGQPVLTWFQAGDADGARGIVYNDRFQQIATVKAGNGFTMDEHEFLITPWNTALILADSFTTANLTSIGGPADQQVVTPVVQEIDIKTGRVLFQWNPTDYVPYSDSHLPLPSSASQPWDWFHINAVHLDTDGNLLVSSRHTWAIYKVNRHTGDLMWELGGKQSSFTLKTAPGQALDSAGEIFAWQHDPEGLGHGLYTVFDDESGGEYPFSRAVTVQLNLRTHVATLVKSINQPEGLVAAFSGNAQTTSNGDLFVGWGGLPYISEFSPSGKLLFNAELPSGVFTYRAYLLPWPPGTAGIDPRARGTEHTATDTARRLISREPGDSSRVTVPEVPVTG